MSSTDNIKPCPECGGQRIMVESYIVSRRKISVLGKIFLRQSKRKQNTFQRKYNTSDMTTLTCLSCGYTAWYAQNLNNLLPDT
jgi:predicted nucleic-acid-binding Zn-ribbon protein